MATRAVVAGWLVLALARAAAAGPVTLEARSLLTTPGVVAVDRENVTVVQFCDTISWLAYKAPWLHAQVSQQDRRVLLLDASAASGEAAMAVWVEGQGAPLQLLVRASGTALANHLYVVSCAAPARQAQAAQGASQAPQGAAQAPQGASARGGPQAQAGAAAGGAAKPGPSAPAERAGAAPTATDWDAFISGLSPRQWGLLQALITTPTAEAYATFTASLSPSQAAAWAALAQAAHLAPPTGEGGAQVGAGGPAGPAAEQPAPPWLVWQAHAARGDGGLLVAYTVTNTGTAEVVLDGARLRVLDADGRPLAASVSRQDTSGFEGRLEPGGVESGVIRVPAAPPGGVTIRWPAVEIGGGTTYLLASSVAP